MQTAGSSRALFRRLRRHAADLGPTLLIAVGAAALITALSM
jgi:hypothetical protein